MGQGNYQNAVPMFQRVIELTPDNRWGYTNLGVAYYHLDRLDEAAAMRRRTLEIRPDATAYSNLGTVSFLTGHYAESVGPFEKAVERDPVWSKNSSGPLPHARTSLQAQVLINQAR
jgi:Flp pilus assembly protein TadD